MLFSLFLGWFIKKKKVKNEKMGREKNVIPFIYRFTSVKKRRESINSRYIFMKMFIRKFDIQMGRFSIAGGKVFSRMDGKSWPLFG